MAYKQENLGSGEKLVYETHKHAIVLIKAAAQWILLFIVALVFAVFINSQSTSTTPGDFFATAKPIILLICLLAGFVSFVAFGIAYLFWQSEHYVITNERVIQGAGIINKQESSTALDKVNDIQTHQTLLGRMLGYGTVLLQTGNDTGDNNMDYLKKPFDFKRIILDAKNKHYGDASDMAPGGRFRDDENDGYQRGRNQVRESQSYQVAQPLPPVQPQSRSQPAYSSDPRGYAPQQPSTNPQQNTTPNGYVAGPGGSQSHSALNPQQIADSIQQLARLRDNGIISEAEFQAKKNDLMNRL